MTQLKGIYKIWLQRYLFSLEINFILDLNSNFS